MNEVLIEKHITEQLKENAAQSAIRAEKLAADMTLSNAGILIVSDTPVAGVNATVTSIEATAAIRQLTYFRGHILELSERLLYFRKSEITHACDINEARANLTLAYRHLEDARMRLGKAIQALDGGVSVYDK